MMEKKKWNLQSNFRLVILSSSAPVSDHQEAHWPVSLDGLLESLKLCIGRRRETEEDEEENRAEIQNHLLAAETFHGAVKAQLRPRKRSTEREKEKSITSEEQIKISLYSADRIWEEDALPCVPLLNSNVEAGDRHCHYVWIANYTVGREAEADNRPLIN